MKKRPGHTHRKPIPVDPLLMAARSAKAHTPAKITLRSVGLTEAEIEAKYGALEPARKVRVDPVE
jgi:hypothetical protein